MRRQVFILLSLFISMIVATSSLRAQPHIENEDSLRNVIQQWIGEARQVLNQRNINSFEDIKSADSLLKKASEIAQYHFGYYDSLNAWSYYYLAVGQLYVNNLPSLRKYAEAMADIVDSAFKDDLKLNIYSLAILGDAYVEISEYSRAIGTYRQEINLLGNNIGQLNKEQISWYVNILVDIARTTSVISSDHEKILQLYNDALKIIEEHLGEDHWLYPTIIGNIGRQYGRMRDYNNAEKYTVKAIELKKKRFGEEHRSTVWSSIALANYYRIRGDFRSADSLISLQLKIMEKTMGNSHPHLRQLLYSQAALIAAQKKFDQAIDKSKQFLDICRSKSDFPSHYKAFALITLGKIAAAAGDTALLANTISDLSSTRQSYLINVFGYASEAQKLSFVQQHPPIESHLLAGVIQYPHQISTEAGINMVLGGKGLAIDAMTLQQTSAVCKNDPILDSLLFEHSKICEHIADLAFSSKAINKDKTLEELFFQKSELEAQISTECIGIQFNDMQDSVSCSAVISALPRHSALLEYVQYEDYDYSKVFMNTEYDSSYAAIVITSSGEKSIVNLGKSSTIDSLIEEYHAMMSNALYQQFSGKNKTSFVKFKEVSTNLYRRLVTPLENYLTGLDEIYVAADGAINLLPFETLIKAGDRFLIEDYQFVYLTSGRDLIKDKTDLSNNDAIVMADPDYMLDPTVSPALASESTPIFAHRGNTATPECLKNMFSPLPKTRLEGNSVAGILKETEKYNVYYLESESARESYLKDLAQPPQIIHIATHGYFCRESENVYLSNPLLRSGLILAGANRTIGELKEGAYSGEDGILTAMEVSGLNLIGTDLVVLSACQSGVGDVQNGEGVFGLRRAFQQAGAKSIIMSLYAVPDKSTSIFMERFYSNWLSGDGKAEALRKASLSIIKELRATQDFAHPLFWGGFILAGNPD